MTDTGLPIRSEYRRYFCCKQWQIVNLWLKLRSYNIDDEGMKGARKKNAKIALEMMRHRRHASSSP
uniref:Uncharacterized protein n=1 Tax=Onchocerca volvulus TaxID=6282 RepID=A0A8R1XZ81_ONCVO